MSKISPNQNPQMGILIWGLIVVTNLGQMIDIHFVIIVRNVSNIRCTSFKIFELVLSCSK